MEVRVKYEGQIYIAKYNKQSDYYEIELNANQTGIQEIEVQTIDLLGKVENEIRKIQVLALEDNSDQYKEKNICYIYSKNDLSKKDVKKVTDHNLDLDDETNNSSSISFGEEIDVEEKDYILLKTEERTYLGIFTEFQEEKSNDRRKISIKDISNIFDEKVFLKHEEIIKTEGLETFLKLNIEEFFSNSGDNITDKRYIRVIVKTNTKLNKSIDVDEEGMYNFHTFAINCKQNYDIDMDYEIKNQELIITIEKKEKKERFIDCTVADVLDYKKVYGNEITSKVEVMCKDTKRIFSYGLDTNDDNKVKLINQIADENRAVGKIERLTIEKENEAEAFQSAVDRFKGNDYNFLIEFSLYKNSKIMPHKDLMRGTLVKIKTKDGRIQKGYITARTEKMGSNIISFRVGRIRKTLRQQLKQNKVGRG